MRTSWAASTRASHVERDRQLVGGPAPRRGGAGSSAHLDVDGGTAGRLCHRWRYPSSSRRHVVAVPPASWVDLHPAGADALVVATDPWTAASRQAMPSIPLATSDTPACGAARASLVGGPASRLDRGGLNRGPSRRGRREAGRQYARVDGFSVLRASLWTGTPDSWVRPAPRRGEYVERHRSRRWSSRWGMPKWTATFAPASGPARPSSWVDLHPIAWRMKLLGGLRLADGGQQVGVTADGAPYRAALWSGTRRVACEPARVLAQEVHEWSLGESAFRTMPHIPMWSAVAYNSQRQRNEAIMWRADNAPPSAPARRPYSRRHLPKRQ